MKRRYTAWLLAFAFAVFSVPMIATPAFSKTSTRPAYLTDGTRPPPGVVPSYLTDGTRPPPGVVPSYLTDGTRPPPGMSIA